MQNRTTGNLNHEKRLKLLSLSGKGCWGRWNAFTWLKGCCNLHWLGLALYFVRRKAVKSTSCHQGEDGIISIIMQGKFRLKISSLTLRRNLTDIMLFLSCKNQSPRKKKIIISVNDIYHNFLIPLLILRAMKTQFWSCTADSELWSPNVNICRIRAKGFLKLDA